MSASRPCRACGCPIVFAPTGEMNPKTGKPITIPLDMRSPVYLLTPDGRAQRAEQHHVTHFATCSKASSFSKKQTAPGNDAAAITK